MTHVHSVPAEAQPAPCETIGRRAAPPLRPYVVGYGGFRSGTGAAVRHRVLPLNLTTAIVDLTGEVPVVTGPRGTPAVLERIAWARGITIGFTPFGVRSLLGASTPELAGRTVALADLLGRAEAELVGRLAVAATWNSRFDLLDTLLRRRLAPSRVDPLVALAWWQLQADGVRVGDLARRLAVSRRHLELAFRRDVGMTPGTVGRIARFQRAIGLLAGAASGAGAGDAGNGAPLPADRGGRPAGLRGLGLPAAAADSGYADQPHFTRDVRAMSGLTPTELFAFLQYREPATP